LLACAACTTRADAPATPQASRPAAPVAAPAPTQPDTLTQIKDLIGKAECSSDNQCQILPIGARPCGGPASYLAWSTARTPSGDIQALADRFRAEQQERNARSGMVSDCRAIAPPAAVCRAGSCQLTDALSVK
jgi:hypothetical protein